MGLSTADILGEPCWFPLRFDVANDVFVFGWIPPETLRALTFIADFRPTQVQSIPRAAVREVPTINAPMHLVLHSGLGGSTLLSRALAQPGVVTTLKEPPILTDVVAFGLQSSSEEMLRLLGQVAQLLSRPFAAGESLVCKMSSVGNGLGADIAAMRPDTQVLCLQTPLDRFLASLASKREQGRAGARRLFVGLQNSRMTIVTVPENELGDYPDLALAALAWLSIQKLMIDAGDRLGPDRVRSLRSETLLTDPAASLKAVADHFGLALDVEARIAAGVFGRHAKTGQAFDEGQRAAAFEATLAAHRAEIDEITEWAHKVAQAQQVAWALSYPLLG